MTGRVRDNGRDYTPLCYQRLHLARGWLSYMERNTGGVSNAEIIVRMDWAR